MWEGVETDLVLKMLVARDIAGEPWLNSQQSKRLLNGGLYERGRGRGE